MYKACKTGFTRQPVPSSRTLQDGSTTTSVKETANALLHNFFPDDSTDSDNGKQKSTRAQITYLRSPDSQPEPNFTEHEVDEVISKLDESKCPGLNGIDGNIVERLQKYLPKVWFALYNKCFPKVWKNARVIAISKADKTKLRSVEGYRGVSLLSGPGKFLEKLVIERLNHFLETTGQISSLQFGLTAGRSTADAIKTVSDFVGHSRKRGRKCCVLALDIAGAFDNAWHPGILARLRKLKCPPNTYNMVKDFLCDRTAHVTLGNSLSSKRVTKGSPQGSAS